MCFDGIEGEVDMRRVVHRQHDAGDDLHAQHERQDAAEGPPVVQVARRRIGDEGGMDQPGDRQPPFQPSHECVLRLVGRVSAHGRTLRESCRRSADPDFGVGDEFVGRQSQIGGAGPLRMRPDGVVDRAVAGAEVAVIVALMGERDAAEMGADADQRPATGHDLP